MGPRGGGIKAPVFILSQRDAALALCDGLGAWCPLGNSGVAPGAPGLALPSTLQSVTQPGLWVLPSWLPPFCFCVAQIIIAAFLHLPR